MMKNIAKMPEKVTEVAEHFGLSRSTVSYILNDKWAKRRISEATAQKVWEYVRETGFQPNAIGLALKGKTVKEIAIIIPADPLEHHKHALFRLINNLEQNKKSYLVLPVTDNKLSETIQLLKMYRVKKLVSIAFGIGKHNLRLWQNFFRNMQGAEYVLYDFPFEKISYDELLLPGNNAVIGFNREKARRKIIAFIIKKGYRDIIIPRGLFGDEISDYLKRKDLKFEEYRCSFDVTAPSLFRMGEDAARQLLKLVSPGKSKAVFMNDDKMTFAAIKYLLDRGVKIPGELAFISWDGLPESEYFSIPLTTLEVPHEEMLTEVLKWTNGEKTGKISKLDPHIREGKSLPRIPSNALSR